MMFLWFVLKLVGSRSFRKVKGLVAVGLCVF